MAECQIVSNLLFDDGSLDCCNFEVYEQITDTTRIFYDIDDFLRLYSKYISEIEKLHKQGKRCFYSETDVVQVIWG